MNKLGLLCLLAMVSLQLQSMDQGIQGSGIKFSLTRNFKNKSREEQKAEIAWALAMKVSLEKGLDHPDAERLMDLFLQAQAAIPKKEVQKDAQGRISLASLMGTGFFQDETPVPPVIVPAAAASAATSNLSIRKVQFKVPQSAMTDIEALAASMSVASIDNSKK